MDSVGGDHVTSYTLARTVVRIKPFVTVVALRSIGTVCTVPEVNTDANCPADGVTLSDQKARGWMVMSSWLLFHIRLERVVSLWL